MMGKGMEMMIGSIVKSLGVDPDMLMAKIAETQRYVVEFVQRFDTRMSTQEQKTDALIVKVDKLIALHEKQTDFERDMESGVHFADHKQLERHATNQG